MIHLYHPFSRITRRHVDGSKIFGSFRWAQSLSWPDPLPVSGQRCAFVLPTPLGRDSGYYDVALINHEERWFVAPA